VARADSALLDLPSEVREAREVQLPWSRHLRALAARVKAMSWLGASGIASQRITAWRKAVLLALMAWRASAQRRAALSTQQGGS